MTSSILTCPILPSDYAAKYGACNLLPQDTAELGALRTRIFANQQRYFNVASMTSIPWYLIASLHILEANGNFGTFIQNGDPLFDHDGDPLKSVHVPKGLGPFATWEDSCAAAFKGALGPWDVGACLKYGEHWNGLGYRHRGVTSPYIWSYTDQYEKGKYGSDGVFDPDLVSKQPGMAAIFKILGVS